MPTYEIKAPDGNSYRIEGPAGASDDQVREQVLKQHPGAEKATAPEGERSGVGDFFKSVPRGAVQGLTGIPALAGTAAASDPEMAGALASVGKQNPDVKDLPSQEYLTRKVEQNVTGDLPKPQGNAGKFGAAVGEVMGNPATYLGPGSMLLKTGAGVASALASEGAGQLTEGTGLETPARIGAGILAGGGVSTAASEHALSKLASQLPTRETIKDAATAGYDMLKASNTRISPQGTLDLLAAVKADLHADHFRDYLAPTTYRALEELGQTGAANIGDLDGVRRLLGRVPGTNPTDKEAARRAIDAIDNFLQNVDPAHIISGDPARDAAILKHAQGNWALHKQLETLEDASVKGQHRAGVSGSGANRINTARQEVRKILDSDKKSRGMSDAAKDKMEEIVMGTWLTNATRQAGKFAPSGPVSATTSILAGMGAGAGAGAAVAGGGFIAKHLGEYLTDKQIRELEQLLRSESPIGKPIAKAIAPQIAEQKAIPAASALRAAATSPLAADGP